MTVDETRNAARRRSERSMHLAIPDYGGSALKYPTTWERRHTAEEPYKGTESYQFEDADLFFGRQRETSELVALFLRGPLSVFHAPSGAGKSSILNARVIPDMQRASVNAVRMTPQDNPLEALRVSMLLQLIPPPETEADAIDQMLGQFPRLADAAIEEVIETYDAIEIADPARRKLIAPYDVKVWFDPNRCRSGVTTPYFSRLLSGTATIRSYWRHFAALFDLDEVGDAIREDAWRDARLSQIRDLMASERARRAHREWIDRLDLPEFGFVRFMHHFWTRWASKQSGYAICIVIDQFEEIFTRFTDSQTWQTDRDSEDIVARDGAAILTMSKPNWQLRPTFFIELRRLLTASEQPGGAPLLPVSVVLSMRDEYLGQLRAVPEIRGLWERAQYRLDFIDRNDADRVIREPAKAFGYDYDEACYEQIVADLLREERYIEPAHIQLVCERLWNKLGRQLHDVRGREAASHRPVIDLDTFLKKTGGSKQILGSHFGDTLRELLDEDQIEAIDILSPLLTSQGTRNVVEVMEIVNAPLRDPKQRERILERLRSRNIVRIESRIGGKFVEITHEFLLRPLQEEIGRRSVDTDEQSFRFALRSLAAARAGKGSEAAVTARVSEPVLRSLLKHASRVIWVDWAVRLLLRAALAHGATREEFSHIYALFAEVVAASRQDAQKKLYDEGPDALKPWLEDRIRNRDWLDSDELETMRTRFLPKWGANREVSQMLGEICLISALHRAGAADADMVRVWTRLALEQTHAAGA